MIINKIKNNWLLIVVLLVGTILRFWMLGSVPPHLTPDEASLGYNAFSILKTGRDEYGNLFPIIFKSFGDYKPGLYIYASVPFVWILGLNEVSVRFVSALAGVFNILFIYLIAKKLFSYLNRGKIRFEIIAAFVASINPWLIYFSRGAWEVNLSLALTLAGIYFFLTSDQKPKRILFSVISFALTLLCYQGAKLSSSIVVILLLFFFTKKIKNISKKFLLASVLTGLLISIPILVSIFGGKVGRLTVFSVFSSRRPQEYLTKQLTQGNETVGDFKYYLFHSEALNFARGIMGRYFNHFSGRFLFFEGDWSNPRHTAPNSGVLLLGDIVFLIAGFVFFIRKKLNKEGWFFMIWLLTASLPAILSRDQVHAVRSFNMSIPLVFLISLGIYFLLISLEKLRKYSKRTLYLFLTLMTLVSYIYFLDSYFVHLPNHDSNLWEYGYKQVVETVVPIKENYEKIKVQQSFAQPYIYFLFYQKYDPVKYQKQAILTDSGFKGDVGYVEKIDNIYFSPIDWSINRGERGVLFVADSIRIPYEDSKDESMFKLISEIKYLNKRDIAFRIIEVR